MPKTKRDSRAEKTAPPSSRYSPIKLPLPVWYLKRIDEEVALLRFKSRADFLNHLLLWKAGIRPYARPETAPRPKAPTDAQLKEHETYVWNVTPDLKQMLEQLQLKLGGGVYQMPTRLWVLLTLNEWFGLPINPGLGAQAGK